VSFVSGTHTDLSVPGTVVTEVFAARRSICGEACFAERSALEARLAAARTFAVKPFKHLLSPRSGGGRAARSSGCGPDKQACPQIERQAATFQVSSHATGVSKALEEMLGTQNNVSARTNRETPGTQLMDLVLVFTRPLKAPVPTVPGTDSLGTPRRSHCRSWY
jgi:hypothetical protein